MGRPRKDQTGKPVKRQIEDAFWELLREGNYSHISASEIVRRVGCNRNTFYYHFDSVEDLTMQVIERAIPVEIPVLAEACFKGALPAVPLGAGARRSIECLCLLIARAGSPVLVDRVKDALKTVWIERFELDGARQDVACVLEFMAGGVVGTLGYWGSQGGAASLDECFSSVSSVFSKPAVAFAEERRGL